MKIDNAIVEAREAGLSVIEISRAIRWKANDVHDFLRKKGLIEPVKKWSAKTQTLNLNGRILAKLRTKGLSFDRWSIGWGFATAEAEELLTTAVNPADSDSLAIHHALCRDLPNEYICVYGGLLVKPVKFPAWTSDRFSFSLDWDSEKFRYVARIVGLKEFENVTGIGPGPKDALDGVVFNAKIARQKERLKKAIQFAQENYD